MTSSAAVGSCLLFLQMRSSGELEGSMQSIVTGLLSPKALYLIRTSTVTLLHRTATLCSICTSCVHISCTFVLMYNKILHQNQSLSVHPVTNDPSFLYWCCVSLMHDLLDEGTVMSIVTGLQAGQLRNCGSYSGRTRDFSCQTGSEACVASFSAYWGHFL